MKRKNLDRWKLLHRSVGDFLPQPATCVCVRERARTWYMCEKRGGGQGRTSLPPSPVNHRRSLHMSRYRYGDDN